MSHHHLPARTHSPIRAWATIAALLGSAVLVFLLLLNNWL